MKHFSPEYRELVDQVKRVSFPNAHKAHAAGQTVEQIATQRVKAYQAQAAIVHQMLALPEEGRVATDQLELVRDKLLSTTLEREIQWINKRLCEVDYTGIFAEADKRFFEKQKARGVNHG